MTRLVRVVVLTSAVVLTACGGGPADEAPPASSSSTTSADPSSSAAPPAARASVRWTPHVATARTARWHLPYAAGRQATVPESPGRVLLAGGLLAGDTSTGQVVDVDLRHGRVAAMPALAVPVHDTAGGLVGPHATVVGGGSTSEQDVIQQLEGRAWHVVGHLPTTRSDLSVIPTPRGPWVLGGYDGAAAPRAILALGSHGSARPVGRLAVGVRYAATAELGHTAYVLGGEVRGRELAAVQAVDLRTGRTRVVARLPVPVGHAMAATMGRKILVVGGRTAPDSQTAAMWWWDPQTGRFSAAGHLPHPLSDAAVASYRHRVWLLGGEDPSVTAGVLTISVR